MTDDPFEGPPAEAPPREGCYFYHTMEVPGYGLFPGQWDLRAGVDAYLGGIPLAGESVLEIGPASGYLTFHMEAKGASVTACELGSFDQWDIVPYDGVDLGAYVEDRVQLGRALRNAFWLAHRAHGSAARLFSAPVYEIPEQVGDFDVALVGSVLLHVRDPFLALQRIAQRTTGALVVTEVVPGRGLSAEAGELVRPQSLSEGGTPERQAQLAEVVGPELEAKPPRMDFIPSHAKGEPKDTWWQPNPAVIRQMLGVLGFTRQRINYHYQVYDPKRRWANADREAEAYYLPHYTIVAER